MKKYQRIQINNQALTFIIRAPELLEMLDHLLVQDFNLCSQFDPQCKQEYYIYIDEQYDNTHANFVIASLWLPR